MILFGSCRRKEFVLDTVFVVRDWIEYTADDFQSALSQYVCEEFMHVTLLPLYATNANISKCSKMKGRCDEPDPGQSWRLYRGATPEEPVEGMFSFFPCQPAVENSKGFAKPRIAMPKLITDALLQGRKLTCGLTNGEIKKHFQDVRGQVELAGLSLGVYAELPKLRKGGEKGRRSL